MMTGAVHSQPGLLVSGRFAELEDALAERVAELKRGRPLAPLTIVVGSAAVRTRVGDLLVRRLGGFANVRVTTLSQLAADLVGQAAGAPPVVLTGLARERLVRRLVAAHAADLSYFTPVVERPHFAAALAATFTDLREARVAPDSGWAQAVSAAGVQSVGPASADLDLLYRAYCRRLESLGVLDGAAVYAAAADAVAAGGDHAHTVLYGVYDLNQAQQTFAAALLSAGADVLVPVPREAAPDGVTMLAAALAAGLAERRLEPLSERADLDVIAALWRDPSSDGPTADSPAAAGDGTLTVVSVPDERAEAREAVRAVVAAAEAGVPLRDCAVVVPRGDDVERVAAALTAAGLPVACRLPERSPGPRLLLKLADCLAPPAGAPFARRAVVDLLTAAPPPDKEVTPGDAALWLDEAREAGVVCGLEQWVERVGARLRGLERDVADRELRGAAAELDDEGFDRLAQVRLRLRAARSLEAAVDALARACGGLPHRAAWPIWAGALAAVAAAVAEPDAAAAARDAAGRLHALAVLGEEVELDDAVATLRELLTGATVSEGRTGRVGVAVLTPLELRGLRFHTVVFAGLAEGGFPVRGRPDPLMGDAARRGIAEALAVRLPLAEQRGAESMLLFAFACEAATDRLVLLSPRTDAANGRPRLPSRVLMRFASLSAGHAVGVEEFLSGAPLAPVWRRMAAAPGFSEDVSWVDARERDVAALLELSESGRRSAAADYLSAVLADRASAERRLSAWRAARSPEPGPWDGLLGPEACRALASRHPFDAEMHPTRLERYIGCPFAFLLRDVYRLGAPDEPGDSLEMDALEFGTLAHEILERVYRRVIEQDLAFDGALAAVTDSWTEGCLRAERRGVTGAALAWQVRRDLLREDLLETVRNDPVFLPEGGRPAAVEWRFGEIYDRRVLLELDDGRPVRFAGRLDRIDATAFGARVIDYKTGAGGTERNRLKEGLSVQLPVYQLAVRQAGESLGLDESGEEPATVSSVYRLVTRRGGFEDLVLPGDEQTAGERLKWLVTQAVELVDAGLFPRTTRGRCEYCDVAYACGVSSWARARKREHPVLGPVVDLQKPAAKDDGHDS